MKVKIKKLHKDAQAPKYATKGAACFDIQTIEEGHVGLQPKIFHTGIAFELPKDHVMLVFSRSGHGFNQGIRLGNCVGVIDEDYRGELKVKLTSDEHVHKFDKGDRIAQALIVPIERVEGFVWEHELEATERDCGGFGSTDVLNH